MCFCFSSRERLLIPPSSSTIKRADDSIVNVWFSHKDARYLFITRTRTRRKTKCHFEYDGTETRRQPTDTNHSFYVRVYFVYFVNSSSFERNCTRAVDSVEFENLLFQVRRQSSSVVRKRNEYLKKNRDFSSTIFSTTPCVRFRRSMNVLDTMVTYFVHLKRTKKQIVNVRSSNCKCFASLFLNSKGRKTNSCTLYRSTVGSFFTFRRSPRKPTGVSDTKEKTTAASAQRPNPKSLLSARKSASGER